MTRPTKADFIRDVAARLYVAEMTATPQMAECCISSAGVLADAMPEECFAQDEPAVAARAAWAVLAEQDAVFARLTAERDALSAAIAAKDCRIDQLLGDRWRWVGEEREACALLADQLDAAWPVAAAIRARK